MARLLLIDDHPAILEGSKNMIEKEEGMEVFTESAPERALKMIREQEFDLMIFDLMLPGVNGIDLVKKALDINPEASILIYTGHDITPYFNDLIQAGIIGFISKTSTRDQLITAIRCAMRKEVILPLGLLRKLRLTDTIIPDESNSLHSIKLSDEERKIINELEKGKTNREIAKAMFVSQRSLEYNLTELFQKLGVKSRIEAVAKAQKLFQKV